MGPRAGPSSSNDASCAQLVQLRSDLERHLSENVKRLFPRARYQGRPRSAKDAGLLARDRRHGRPQVFRVIERNRSDDREAGRRDVGGVEAASQPHFEDREVQTPVRENEERRRRQGFEIGHRYFGSTVRRLEDPRQRGIELLRADVLFRDPQALRHGDQMGRRVEAGAQPRRLRDRGKRGGRRAFAVGAGDQNRGDFSLRPAGPLANRVDRREAQLHASRREGLQARQGRKAGNGKRSWRDHRGPPSKTNRLPGPAIDRIVRPTGG